MAKKMGRPRKEINWDEFDKLCYIQCTEEEIAAWFGCSIQILKERCKEEFGLTFREVFEQKRKKGHSSLRRTQFKKATGGSDTMLIWLGKQYLKQTDKLQVDVLGSKEWDAVMNNVVLKVLKRHPEIDEEMKAERDAYFGAS